MEYKRNNQNNQINHVKSLNDPKEFNRLLMQYGGIFKDNIKDFAETLKVNKPIKNYSR